jgi:hypothetical protein
MHRLMLLLVLCSCGTSQSPGTLLARDQSEAPAPVAPRLIVAGSVEVASRDVDGLVHAIRARVLAAHGHVMSE